MPASPIEIRCLYDEKVPVHSLKPHEKNRNKHPDDQIERLAQLLSYQGIRAPIVVSRRSGQIVKGHGTLQAIKRCGWDHAPVVYQDFDSEEQEYAFLQGDNAIAAWASLDLSEINADLGDLGPDFNIDLLGIKDFVLEPADKLNPQCDEDEIPERVEPRTKLGDIYQLGRHRLMCGDSTQISDVEQLTDGERADMVFTDPPYGVDYSGGIRFRNDGSVEKESRERLKNDDSDQIYQDIIPVIAAFCDGPCYTWFAGSMGAKIYAAIEAVGQVHTLLVWNKVNAGFGALNSHYKQKHEVFLYWKPKGSTLRWSGPSNEITIWEQKREPRNEYHPTQKPVELAERAIRNHEVDSVLDLFGGSGSTLIACEKTSRRCFMMELDPHYCDVIVSRWEKYTGQRAELLDG